MAKFTRTISNMSFDVLIRHIQNGILNGSMSASLEDACQFSSGDAQCATLVFERYSMLGSNRVSLTVTLFQRGSEPIYVSGITSGGSQAVLFKINTLGEEAFLDKLRALLQ